MKSLKAEAHCRNLIPKFWSFEELIKDSTNFGIGILKVWHDHNYLKKKKNLKIIKTFIYYMLKWY